MPQLQAKLEVGPSSDHFEREADSVASRVMRGSEAAIAIPPTITPLGAQRKAVPKREEKERVKPAKPSLAQRKTSASPPKDLEEKNRKTSKAQRESAAGASGGTASPAVSDGVASMQAGSAPRLDASTRSFMEGRFGRDFGDVRIHNSSRAAAAAEALSAKAFTVGNDVFFNQGQYQPHSASGRTLLAHELTHTIQQTGGTGLAARKRVQRATRREDEDQQQQVATGVSSTTATPTQFDISALPGARVDTTNVNGAKGTITVPTLALPAVAGAHKGTEGPVVKPVAGEGRQKPIIGSPLSFNPEMPSRDHDSVPAEVWTRGARSDTDIQTGVKSKINQKVAAAPDAASILENSVPVYYFKLPKGNATNVFIGTVDELAHSDALLRPQWSRDGTPLFGNSRFDADHFLEMQLGGADVLGNMWLLEASYNRSVGSRIASNMRSNLNAIVNQANSMAAIPETERPDTLERVRNEWIITFARVVEGSNFPQNSPAFWTKEQIKSGLHLDPLEVMNEADMVTAGLRLRPGQQPKKIKVFPSLGGGLAKTLDLGANGSVRRPSDGELFRGIVFNSGTYTGGQALDAPESDLMTINVTVLKTKRTESEEVIERKTGDVVVKRAPRLGIAGYLSRASIMAAAATTRFKPLSPLTFANIGITPEGVLAGTGTVGSTKLLLPGLNVPLSLYGDQIGLNFPVTSGVSLGPVEVTAAGLFLGVNEGGFLVEGYADFLVQSLGNGTVTARLGDQGPELTGMFNLAMDFLKPATVSATYNLANDTFAASATLGVQEGRIPGVESGLVTVAFTRDAIDVHGTINLGGALAGTVVNVTYTQAEGLKIGADNIPLPFSNLPAVQNASLSIAATKPPNAEGWSFSGHGTATLAVPGATGTLDIDYLDGAIMVHGQGRVEKGPASGTLDFTATNREIDADGRPIDGPLSDTIHAWGRGSVTVRFGEILTGTAGIEYTPDNRVLISGTIAMPPIYEVFERRDYNKDLFTLSPPEFPIWGVSVAGFGIGIFAFVDARVFFESFVGPGQIRDASVTATMDLERPEDATVHGHGEFYVPAYAGLGLDVGGGLRARAAVAYVEGRVGLIGRLGVEAGAGAIVDFDWSRNTGLALHADLHAEATPKFDLSATASVTVGVDLLIDEIEHTFGPWQRQLGSFGPDMTLGVSMPVGWSEANGLDLSLDDIVITRPQLNASVLMSDVFDRLAS